MNTYLNYIGDYSFSSQGPSPTELGIGFLDNGYLNGTSFATNSLANISRPVYFVLSGSGNLIYLEKNVFYPFLSKLQNKLNLGWRPFDCNDCHNSWIKTNQQMLEYFKDFQCSNGWPVIDPDNFENCETFLD